MAGHAEELRWEGPRVTLKVARQMFLPSYWAFALFLGRPLWIRLLAVPVAWIIWAALVVRATSAPVTADADGIQIREQRIRWDEVEAVGDKPWWLGWAGGTTQDRERTGWVLAVTLRDRNKARRLPATARYSRSAMPSALELKGIAPPHVALLGHDDPTVDRWRKPVDPTPSPRMGTEWEDLRARTAKVRQEIDELRERGGAQVPTAGEPRGAQAPG